MQEKLAITVLVITLALFALVYVLYTIVRDRQADYTQTILCLLYTSKYILRYQIHLPYIVLCKRLFVQTLDGHLIKI